MREETQLAVDDKTAFFFSFITLQYQTRRINRIDFGRLTLPVGVLKPPSVAVNLICLALRLLWVGEFQLA